MGFGAVNDRLMGIHLLINNREFIEIFISSGTEIH